MSEVMKYARRFAATTALVMAGTGCGAAERFLSRESANGAQVDPQALDEQSLQQISEIVLREWEEDGVKKTASYQPQDAGRFILTLDEEQQSAGQAARNLRLEIGCNGTAPTVNSVGDWPESESSPADYEQGLKEEGYCADGKFSLDDAKALTRLLSPDEIRMEEPREKTLLTENKDGFTSRVTYSSAGNGVVRHTAKNNKTGEEVLALTQKCAADGSGVLESTLGPDLNRIFVNNGADFGGKAADLFAGCDDGQLSESEARVAMSLALSKE